MQYPSVENPYEVASHYGVDVAKDLADYPGCQPSLVLVSMETGSAENHVQIYGADYTFMEVQYVDETGEARALRAIASILPGNRTELAYWTYAAPAQEITTHKGRGHLFVGDPATGNVEKIELSTETPKPVILKPGTLYTIKCDENASEGLVISSLYAPPPSEADWDDWEVTFDPQDSRIEGDREASGDLQPLDVPGGFLRLGA